MLGLDKLLVKLDNLENIDLDEVLNKACILVENDAKRNAPVNTGNLRNSITHKVDGTEGVVGTNVEYAPYVEFGTGLFSSLGDGRQDVPWRYQTADGQWHTTSGQNPQPFLQPALDKNRDDVINLFKEAIEEATK